MARKKTRTTIAVTGEFVKLGSQAMRASDIAEVKVVEYDGKMQVRVEGYGSRAMALWCASGLSAKDAAVTQSTILDAIAQASPTASVRKAQSDEIDALIKRMPWMGTKGEFVDHAIADKIYTARKALRAGSPE